MVKPSDAHFYYLPRIQRSYIWTRLCKLIWPFVFVVSAILAISIIVELQAGASTTSTRFHQMESLAYSLTLRSSPSMDKIARSVTMGVSCGRPRFWRATTTILRFRVVSALQVF